MLHESIWEELRDALNAEVENLQAEDIIEITNGVRIPKAELIVVEPRKQREISAVSGSIIEEVHEALDTEDAVRALVEQRFNQSYRNAADKLSCVSEALHGRPSHLGYRVKALESLLSGDTNDISLKMSYIRSMVKTLDEQTIRYYNCRLESERWRQGILYDHHESERRATLNEAAGIICDLPDDWTDTLVNIVIGTSNFALDTEIHQRNMKLTDRCNSSIAKLDSVLTSIS